MILHAQVLDDGTLTGNLFDTPEETTMAEDALGAVEFSNDNLSPGLISERMSTPPPSFDTSTINRDDSDLYICKVAVADLHRQFQALLLDQ